MRGAADMAGLLLRNLSRAVEESHELCQNCWSLDRDLNSRRPEYDARVCSLTNRFVIFLVLTAMSMMWDVNSTTLHGITPQQRVLRSCYTWRVHTGRRDPCADNSEADPLVLPLSLHDGSQQVRSVKSACPSANVSLLFRERHTGYKHFSST